MRCLVAFFVVAMRFDVVDYGFLLLMMVKCVPWSVFLVGCFGGIGVMLLSRLLGLVITCIVSFSRLMEWVIGLFVFGFDVMVGRAALFFAVVVEEV